MDIVSCQTCGEVQKMDEVRPGAKASCSRCGFTMFRAMPESHGRTMALALGALIFYLPATILPIVKTQYLGMEETTTIFDGIAALFGKGNYMVASLVFATSIINPGLKITALLLLCITRHRPRWFVFRKWVYKIMQVIDPWNMLYVTLLALVVSLAELGKVATVQPGPGLFCYGAFVLLSICASSVFDKRLFWKDRSSG